MYQAFIDDSHTSSELSLSCRNNAGMLQRNHPRLHWIHTQCPVKANLSTTSTGSIGVVCACTWISTNYVSRSSPTDDRRYVFSRLRVEKERSGVAVLTGSDENLHSRMDRFGYLDTGMHCMLCKVDNTKLNFLS